MKAGVAIGVTALAALVVTWTLTRGGPGTTSVSPPPSRPPAGSPTSVMVPAEAPTARVRRNVFQFADQVRPEEARPARAATLRRGSEPSSAATLSSLPRLVGLVSRGGRVVAALVAGDGEVELAGPGETAAGVVVVAIGEDSVRVRRPDGTEAAILLP